MKKFLSLALALVMALSLVTISAGATEYEDFTDKDEIQYEEAVAVLNRLGIITGYSEGDFRPEGELTRGAAAKIIVSLLIGPEAAEALPTTGNPYPDVPAGNVFAGYISFCKTQEIISGYGDGTFRPNGTLTGFAFAKMLLGALGYDSKIEGFEGSGWTMNVATLGNSTGLFDRLSFKGGDTVNRETACQLALNTLKATMVEYNGSGSTTVTIAGVPVDIGGTQKWSYKTSNQEFARNINQDTAANSSQYYTVEFGEEHFVDLKLEYNKNNPTTDDFGRPSVQWSYKRVTIGTYPLEADYMYTSQVAHNVKDVSAASKINALGLGSYNTQVTGRRSSTGLNDTGNTKLYVNGQLITSAMGPDHVDLIADYTDNGTEVDVYVSYEFAGLIDTVVVVQNQLMQIRSISSSAVALEMYDKDNADANNGIVNPLGNLTAANRAYADGGYNLRENNWKVNDVEVGDKYFELLSGLKVGDLVVVEPVYAGAGTNEYDVGNVYVPETVTGAFTNVRGYGTTEDDRMAINVTVGGTQYPISQWSKDLNGVSGESLKITRGDVTLYLNKHGAAMLAKGIGDASDWMIIGNFRRTMVDNQIVTMVNGWDISGDPLELNLGPKANVTNGFHEGDLVKYSVNTTSSHTDWNLSFDDVYNVYTDTDNTLATPAPYEIKANNSMVRMFGYPGRNGEVNGAEYKDSTGVKFIYVNFDTDGEVSSVDIRSGLQNATNADLKYSFGGGRPAQACVKVGDNGNNAVKAVVVKREATDGLISKLALILAVHDQATIRSGLTAQDNTATDRYATGRVVYTYTAALLDATGKITDNVEIHSYDRLSRGDFVTYTARTVDGYENFYDLHTPLDTVGRNNITVQARMVDYVNADRGLIHAGEWRYLHDKGSDYENKVKAVYNTADGSWMFPAVATNQGPQMVGDGEGKNHNILDLSRALWLDMTGNRISNSKDLKTWWEDHPGKSLGLRMVINDNPESDGFRTAYMVVIYSELSTRNTAEPTKYNSYASWEDIVDTENPVKVPTTGDDVTPPADSASVKFVAADETVDLTTLTLDIKLNGESKTVAEIGAAQLAANDKVTFTIPADYTATYTASDPDTSTSDYAKTGAVEIEITEAMVSGKVAITVSIGKDTTTAGVYEYTAGGNDNSAKGVMLDPDNCVLEDGKLKLAFSVDWTKALDSKGNLIPYDRSGGKIEFSVYMANGTGETPIYSGTVSGTSSLTINKGMPRVVSGDLTAQGLANLFASDKVYIKVDKVIWDDVCVYYEVENGNGKNVEFDTANTTQFLPTTWGASGQAIDVQLKLNTTGTFAQGDVDSGTFNISKIYVNGNTTVNKIEDNGSSSLPWQRPSGNKADYNAKYTTNVTTSKDPGLNGEHPVYVYVDANLLHVYEKTYTVTGFAKDDLNELFSDLADGVYNVGLSPVTSTVGVDKNLSLTVNWDAINGASGAKAVKLTFVAKNEAGQEVDGVVIPEVVLLNDNNAGTKAIEVTGVTENVSIVVKSVEEIADPSVTSVTCAINDTSAGWAANDTIYVFFDKDIEDNATASPSDWGDSTNAGADFINGAAVDPGNAKCFVLTVEGAMDDNSADGSITIPAGEITFKDGTVNSTTVVITVTTTGVRT